MSPIIQKFIQWIARLLVALLLVVGCYLTVALVLSVLPANADAAWGGDVDIYIRSNGVHLELVLPLRNEVRDWTDFLAVDEAVADQVQLVSFGWGDRNFFLNTPQWSDLTVKTAAKALLVNSPSAMHVDYYRGLATNDRCKRISMESKHYQAIVAYVEESFARDVHGQPIRIAGFQYSAVDAFYKATGNYNLFFTSNTWTNQCLKKAGLKASVWTPFDRGTLFHYQ
ncbi:TIGR02117 family protein [Sunxiuqinia dokdonensis]|uniref:Urease-associated protein n=1 Tax=Sunxiuqinia dokdonensis TaxID=1409788 RepID=A0A0L8VEG3_9BACT|nr:TIGR02117 family protein [Sunxiuqinia dokdonensis]KOH46865.1 hypothetical protein NC99_02650 [Sunxiuqinia dokdonensis]